MRVETELGETSLTGSSLNKKGGMMETVIEQSRLQAETVTYQGEIPSVVSCRKCKGEALLLVRVHDDEALIKDQRPESVKMWPHDALVIHIYLCTNCGEMRSTWNQG